MKTAYTQHGSHTYVVRYTHAMYPLALTKVLEWNQRGYISNREAVRLYGQMKRLQVKDDQLCKGR